jgi:putative peptidoglycan lipid II flippase
LTLAGGVLAGNIIGFGRVALTAYLLGTHSRADSLAVAMGPLDSLNSMLTNSMLFAFVPILAAQAAPARTALFLRLRRAFLWLFLVVSLTVVATAPWLMRVLAPGLDADAFRVAVNIARILALSTTAAGIAALYWALLYTERRFGPTAFYQATINLCTILAAVTLWSSLGVYAFPVGYALGVCVQMAVVHWAARRDLRAAEPPDAAVHWRAVLTKPIFFMLYAAGLGLNVTFTRAYATHAGPGTAAAFEYCMRGVGVPLALLVGPLTNSLLPEIARLKSALRLGEAFRLVNRSILIAALLAVAITGLALLLREPVIRVLFQRGNFTADSTKLVSAVFLALGPTLIGWSLLEITSRSLFALDRPWPPVLIALVPVLVNAALTLGLGLSRPQWIGAGASAGALAGFGLLFLIVRLNRRRWMEAG